jgi:hypothetical protein
MGRGARSKRSLAAMVVAAQLVVGTAWAAPAPVRIRVTGERLDPKHAKTLEPRVREAVEGLLRKEHGVTIAEDATTEVEVELRPFEDKKNRDELIFRVTVSSDGNEVYGGQPTSCLQCDETKLLASVRTRVTEAAGHLPERAEEAVADAVPGDDPAVEEEDAGEAAEDAAETEPPVEDEPQPTAPPLTLRNAGLGLLIPGGVALGVGIGLVAVGKREVDDGAEVDLTERNYRPPGIGVAVLGGVAVAAGIALLVTHAARKGARGRVSLSPALERTQAGVVLRGRF